MDKDAQLFVAKDMENGLLTGAACHIDHPDVQKWKDLEMCVMGIRIYKMTVDDFIKQMSSQGVDFDKYVKALELR